MITRRRLLTISAAALAMPARAEAPVRWQGRAMGADVSLTLDAPAAQASAALAAVRTLLTRIEQRFSLYDPASELSQLNRTGHLAAPSLEMVALLTLSGTLHTATGGRFDPTVQPLWQALASGGDAQAARALIGWDRVEISPTQVRLGRGQALTLNGIAQGYATDRVAAALRGVGLGRVLINIGEFAALGGPWRLGIEDPRHGLVDVRDVTDRALATSSPAAMQLTPDTGHILNPITQDPARWSTVTVDAPSAAVADAASTALCLATASEARSILSRLPERAGALLIAADSTRIHLT